MGRKSEYEANRLLADTPRRRINRDYVPTVIPLGEVLKVLGAFTAGLVLIANAEGVWTWLSAITARVIGGG
jgi:hypothetical protein